MKILLLSNSNSEHTQKWAIHLAKKNFEVGIFSFKKCSSDIYEAYPNIKLLFQPVHEKGHLNLLNKLSYFLLLFKLKKIIARFNPDILHAHYISSYGLIGALSGYKQLVVSAWGSDVLEFPKKNPIFKLIIRYVLHQASVITASSEYLSKEIFKYTNKSVKEIPFGIDLALFAPNIGVRRDFTFCSIKHLEKIYNIEAIIKAFKLLSDIHPNIKLKIAGTGTQEGFLMGLAKTLNLDNKVEFVGKIPNCKIPDLLNESDVLINIPNNESFGVSVIEAMACQKGLIVSSIPAFDYLVESNKNGFKIDPMKLEEVFIAMQKYILNKELVVLHGNNNRNKVANEFDFEINLKQMISVYQNLNQSKAYPNYNEQK